MPVASDDARVGSFRASGIVRADCPTCSEIAPGEWTGGRANEDRLRKWARRHAAANPGHGPTVETVRTRVYRASEQ